MRSRTLGLALGITIAVCSTSMVSAATLQWLNPFGAGLTGAVVNEVSADGSVAAGQCVVGYGTAAYGYGFRWERGSGFKKMGATNSYVIAYGLSGDGNTVVGAAGTDDVRGLRATAPNYYGTTIGSMITHNSTSDETRVYSASYDGSVLVGTDTGHAFKWTSASKFTDLGFGSAYDCSGDGSVVVGKSGGAPVYWDAQGAPHSMGSIPGATNYGSATEISSDGKFIAGYVNATNAMGGPRTLAFIWTAEKGMLGLGSLPMDYIESTPTAVADDGSVVVGSWRTGDGLPMYPYGGFMWTPQGGMRNMADVMTQDYGLNLGSIKISTCTGMSADGRFIYGTGKNSLGQQDIWVLDTTVPEPSSLITLAAGIPALFLLRRRK